MEETRPIFPLHGRNYYVDVATDRLVSVDDPEQVLRFVDMDYVGNEYLLDIGYATLRIPALVDLDPAGMAKKYNVSAEAVKSMKDLDLMVDTQVLRDLLSGIPTQVHICGHKFVVDWHVYGLVNTSRSQGAPILFRDLWEFWDPYQFSFCFPFNKKHGVVAHLDERSPNRLPRNTVIVTLPPPVEIDPVGYARTFHLPIESFVRNQPPQRITLARVIAKEFSKLNAKFFRDRRNDRTLQMRHRLSETGRRLGISLKK
ncbi:hypothetical protein [Chitinophaga rhizosphaerae]|uniref:hypothetical protein n=1 Tax=Chitinophaga rhizosphaerae TaxID=1864947 RepID=UPI000F801661|nr:hypothetical protein [Chitinophaga rhizosphaerae]